MPNGAEDVGGPNLQHLSDFDEREDARRGFAALKETGLGPVKARLRREAFLGQPLGLAQGPNPTPERLGDGATFFRRTGATHVAARLWDR